MQCKQCNSDLLISSSRFEAINDDTPEKTTEIYSVLDLVCVNPNCDSYAGGNLDNPRMIIETIKNKVG